MDKIHSPVRAGAFQVWMGQWRLANLDTEGCLFVLRFLLRAFHSRKPEDKFWSFLERFLFAEDHRQAAIDYENCARPPKELVSYAIGLAPEQARALVAYLSECYAEEGDRTFWTTVSEAIQLYTVAPYEGRSAGTA